MDDIFAKLLDKYTPRVNHEVMSGLACTYMKNVEEYMDNAFKSTAKSFTDGLEYVGYERCTPEDEFIEQTKLKSNKRTYDIAKSDLYCVKYKFTHYGKPLPPRYILLPYVNDAGILHLSGPKFHISPVLSDKVISPSNDSIFIKLLKYKFIFKRLYHSVIVNGTRILNYVVYAEIYKRNPSKTKTEYITRAVSCSAHYLFGKYGFSQTFQKYCGFTPVVGDSKTITPENYPSDKWKICKSTGVKPPTYIQQFYDPTDIVVAIPNDKWNNLSMSLITGFYYVVDHFPSRLKVGWLDNIDRWMTLLGIVIFNGNYSESKLYADIETHYKSLDDYIDFFSSEKIKERGYVINDFYDLLALVLEHFNDFVINNKSTSSSMFDKNLEVLYNVLYTITMSISNTVFELIKQSNKKPLTDKEIVEKMNKYLKFGSIYKITNPLNNKQCLESVSYSGDNKYFKLTSKVTPQESAVAKRGKSKGKGSVGEDKHLDISMLEAGSLLFLPKSTPSPDHRINPWINIDLKTGTVIPNPKFNEIRERTNNLFKQKFETSTDDLLDSIIENNDKIDNDYD